MLHGDEDKKSKGGHLHGLGRPGKSEFPPSWDEEKIVKEVISVARHPRAVEELPDGTWLATGVRDHVVVGVYVKPTGMIASGFPIDGPGVKKNPRRGS